MYAYPFLSSLFGSPKTLPTPMPYASEIKAIKEQQALLSPQSNRELQAQSQALMLQAQSDQLLDELLIPAYALVREVVYRQLGLLAYDVQLAAAIALHQGQLIEMQTGEGKTLTAIFPAYLNALLGKGVHLLTFNDYLARRDAQFLSPVYRFLGLSVGFIQEQMADFEKRKAYHSDITYATAKMLGFDYLNSFMAYTPEEILLPQLHMVIVDEADALLIDEAQHPLVLAGQMDMPKIDFYKIARLVANLKVALDFEFNSFEKDLFLTEEGLAKIEQALGLQSSLSIEYPTLLSAVHLALHARMLLQRDIDYVVLDGAIKLVDEFTGRIAQDRKWRNGLQTAVEAKEGLAIQSEGMILNSISLQHLIRLYPKVAGMTATASSAQEEFQRFYGLSVLPIPTNKPCIRVDESDWVFANQQAKLKALIQEVKKVHQSGRPILIGTLSIAESEQLSEHLQAAGLHCQVLNAKQAEKEAAIIAEAGDLYALTIATNMAGRGTDIRLGGKAEKNREAVLALGGLYVIGTNRHESSRIDQQLRGRAGRQGEPGSSRFFISLDDPLMVKYQLDDLLPEVYKNWIGETPIKHKSILRMIDHTQKLIEDQAHEQRQLLVAYADFIELQRQVIQEARQKHLQESPPTPKIKTMLLHEYNFQWALHLNDMQQLRDGIHLVRLGGQHPLREFKRQADAHFERLQNTIQEEIKAKMELLLKNPHLDLAALGIQRPSSTWSYVASESDFGNPLSIMLLDNANIGLQVDFISVLLLFIFSFFRKKN